MSASLNGHDNVVEKLLAAGANPNHQDKVRNLVTRVMLINVPNAFVTNEVLKTSLNKLVTSSVELEVVWDWYGVGKLKWQNQQSFHY